jgi:hypothetical protein
MKSKYLSLAIAGIILAVAAAPAAGQFPIRIPKIPKVVKKEEKKEEPVTTEAPVRATDAPARTTEAPPAAAAVPDKKPAPEEDWRIQYHIDRIAEFKKRIDEWNPETHFFPTISANDKHDITSLWKEERDKWMKDYGFLKVRETPDNRFDAALDALAVSIRKRLPEHLPKADRYIIRNPAEEKLMRSAMKDTPQLKVFKIGLNQANWLIDKNEFGIPRARYKHGMIWGRALPGDTVCLLWFINIVQDYSGGGTYGASYANFIRYDISGCPAGK